MSNILDLGIEKGCIALSGDGKRITYCATDKSYKFTDPEEIVRAEYYVELVTKYGYLPERMGVEVLVPRRTPSDLADIVVFSDSGRKQPYNCRRMQEGWHFRLRILAGDRTGVRERQLASGSVCRSRGGQYETVLRRWQAPGLRSESRNVIADIPVKYGRV